jgi:hypothetical protein
MRELLLTGCVTKKDILGLNKYPKKEESPRGIIGFRLLLIKVFFETKRLINTKAFKIKF